MMNSTGLIYLGGNVQFQGLFEMKSLTGKATLFKDGVKIVGYLDKGTWKSMGGHWFSQVQDYTTIEMINGYGKMLLPDQTTFEGTFQNGVMDSNGRVYLPDGKHFNKKHANQWVYFTKDGTLDKYPTPISRAKVCGVGTMIFPDRTGCQGEFKNGNLIINHRFTLSDGRLFQGYIKNDLYRGTIVYPNKIGMKGKFDRNLNFIKGEVSHPNGVLFQGAMKGGIFQGVCTYPSGIKMKGNFEKDWSLCDCEYEVTHPNGIVFNGKIKEELFIGISIYPDGIKMKGAFEKNWNLLKGEISYPNGKVFQGEVREEIYNGIVTHPTGVEVRGSFTKDLNLMNGNCEITHPDGTLFRGKIENQFFIGFKSSSDVDEEGFFKNWTLNGIGGKQFKNKERHVGQFENGVLIEGTKEFSNGNYLEGKYLNGKLHGYGTIRMKNIKYKAHFIEGVMHGHGQIEKDFFIYEVNFNQGKFDGEMTISCLPKKKFKVLFSNGNMISDWPIELGDIPLDIMEFWNL